MAAETLTAPEVTIAEMGDELASLTAEEELTPELAAETDEGVPTEETQAEPDPAATLEALIANLTDDQLTENPKLKKLIEAREYQVRQSEADKAKYAVAQQAEAQRRSQATIENRQLAMSVIAEEYQKYAEGEAEYNPQRMEAALAASTAHAFTVGMQEIARGLTERLAANYPDYRPDATDSQAFQYAFNARDMPGVVETLINVLDKAALAKHGPNIRQQTLNERAALAQSEQATKQAQKSAADRNDPAKRPTALSGVPVPSRQFRTVMEFDTAWASGAVGPPPGKSTTQWYAEQTRGLPS